MRRMSNDGQDKSHFVQLCFDIRVLHAPCGGAGSRASGVPGGTRFGTEPQGPGGQIQRNTDTQ